MGYSIKPVTYDRYDRTKLRNQQKAEKEASKKRQAEESAMRETAAESLIELSNASLDLGSSDGTGIHQLEIVCRFNCSLVIKNKKLPSALSRLTPV